MNSIFRPEVLAAQQRRLDGHVSLVQPTSWVWLTWLLCSVVAVALFFLLAADYHRKQRVQGILQPEQGVVRLQVQNSGIVTQLQVQEGQRVAAGDTLLVLQSQQFGEQGELSQNMLKGAQQNLQYLQTSREQLLDKHKLEASHFTSKLANLLLQQTEQTTQRDTFSRRLALNTDQLNQLNKLAGSGYISQLEINRQRDLILNLQQQQKTLSMDATVLAAQITAIKNQQQQLPLDQQREMAVLEQQIVNSQTQLQQLQYQQSSVLRSPVAGTVSGLQVKIGQQLASGRLAMAVVPIDQPLEALLYVPSSAIAFIETGQTARIRYHAFAYQRFGMFSGTITEVSHTVLLPSEVTEMTLAEPSYRIRVRLDAQQIQAYQKVLPLKAGMTLDADLITEKRSLWQWLLDPIFSLRGQI